MVAREDEDTGRQPFEVKKDGRDYSGTSTTGADARDLDLRKSFFNGADLVECRFTACAMEHCEFNESRIEACLFVATNLKGCDFVHSEITGSSFVDCDLSHGEWRDARFEDCTFRSCDFTHDTVTLCRFVRCTFDDATCATLQERSIYHNTFSRCTFATRFDRPEFTSRNFGVPAAGEPALVPIGAPVTLEQACRLNNGGKLRAVHIAEATEHLCRSLQFERTQRNSALAFLAKVLRTMTDEERLSATTLFYLEDVISGLARTAAAPTMLTAAMSAIIEIRSALFAMDTSFSDHGRHEEGCSSAIILRFSETYGPGQVEALRRTLEMTSQLQSGTLLLERLENGSTLVELVSTGLVSLASLLAALNFVLHQATVTVERITKLRRAANKAKGKAVTAPKTRKEGVRMPSILDTGTVKPELAPVRTAVRRFGKTLVEMDERAAVTVLAE
jgi:uncharacterized protein YjbI with pentapeptide repeats